jgi:hypothetical protein
MISRLLAIDAWCALSVVPAAFIVTNGSGFSRLPLLLAAGRLQPVLGGRVSQPL